MHRRTDVENHARVIVGVPETHGLHITRERTTRDQRECWNEQATDGKGEHAAD